MLGQEKLLQELHKFNIDSFPRTLMLIGEKGSGKHTIVNHISQEILKLPVLNITENISYEYINEIYRNPLPQIYMIDLNSMTEKDQNVLLKFIEEPLKHSFIVILVENDANVLNTISNRCNKFYLEKYNNAVLKTFLPENCDSEFLLSILTTPGQIIHARVDKIKDTYELANKIVDKINIATYPNTLSISNKLNYKSEYDKLDFDIFLKCLLLAYNKKYIETKDKSYYTLYMIVEETYKKLKDVRLNKKHLIEQMLTDLWLFYKR